MNEWEKTKQRRSDNIGFKTRTSAFSEPSPSEMAAALAIETQSWQKTRGVKHYTISAEYSTPMGHGINLRRPDVQQRIETFEKAKKAYIETPMDENSERLLSGAINFELEKAQDPSKLEEFLVNLMPFIVLILTIIFVFGMFYRKGSL